MSARRTFDVVPGGAVAHLLRRHRAALVPLVERTYVAHADGATVNPPSVFLRFPDRPADRVIALPAALLGADGVDGIKWIASVPGNPGRGLPRAAAVVVLNDPADGRPYACLEGSLISAARTGASAALAAARLRPDLPELTSVCYVGAGPIAREIHRCLETVGARFTDVAVVDRSARAAGEFVDEMRPGRPAAFRVHPAAEPAIRGAQVVVLATSAGAPHLTDPAVFAHRPLVLNVSLRDLGPDVILAADNVVDDVEHCLRENTSPHLAERATGHRDFLTGTLADVLRDKVALSGERATVFSPFGLGVLDLAVARWLHGEARARGLVIEIPDFFVH